MKKLAWILLIFIACDTEKEMKTIDIQGHRGARGLAPENTIPGFLMAAEMGVTTLELDLSVSKDMKLVVSHEPYFSPLFCLAPDGTELSKDSIINFYQMNYDSIKMFDCGSKDHPRFPEQQRMEVFKPLLTEVIDEVERFTKENELTPLLYNIELKTTSKTDEIYHPTPEVFSELVYELISEKDLWDRVNIQSFDFRTLQYFREKYPQVKLALLIENELDWKTNIDSLGFKPEIYSCYYPLLSQQSIKDIQDQGIKVIPWTINEKKDMKQLMDWGVDGIITDYPDRALELIREDG